MVDHRSYCCRSRLEYLVVILWGDLDLWYFYFFLVSSFGIWTYRAEKALHITNYQSPRRFLSVI
jgi:hypothetical protein